MGVISPFFVYMKYLIIALVAVAANASVLQAQPGSKPQQPVEAAGGSPSATRPEDLAKMAVAAHGGDKLKGMRTLVVRGTCDVTSFGQAIPATFVLIIAGPKYYFEINNPFQPLKQIYDGQSAYSSMQAQGFSLPPMTSLGFPLLPRVGEPGFIVSAAANPKKKSDGFRVTTPEGFYTDFYLDGKTRQIKEYESSFVIGDRTVTTSVVVDETTPIEGVIVPKKYSQRFDLGTITAYANFKAKEILVNSEVKDDVFKLPN